MNSGESPKIRELREAFERDRTTIERIHATPAGAEELRELLLREREHRYNREHDALVARIRGGRARQVSDADLLKLVRQRFARAPGRLAALTLREIAEELIANDWNLEGASADWIARRLGTLGVRNVVCSAHDNAPCKMDSR